MMDKEGPYNQYQGELQGEILQLFKHYAKNPPAKNTMIKKITKQFQKLPEMEVYDHFAR